MAGVGTIIEVSNRIMADEIDVAQDREILDRESAIQAVREKASLEPGRSGICDYCGEASIRLVRDACARCRDKYRLG
jgi:hypothetical protein